jgi:hypothetical protein
MCYKFEKNFEVFERKKLRKLFGKEKKKMEE